MRGESAEISRIRASLGEVWDSASRNRPEFGQTRAKNGRHRDDFGRSCPDLVGSTQALANAGPDPVGIVPKSGRIRATRGRNGDKIGRNRPNLVGSRLRLVNIGPRSAAIVRNLKARLPSVAKYGRNLVEVDTREPDAQGELITPAPASPRTSPEEAEAARNPRVSSAPTAPRGCPRGERPSPAPERRLAGGPPDLGGSPRPASASLAAPHRRPARIQAMPPPEFIAEASWASLATSAGRPQCAKQC